jgi:hypothetical protein
MGTGNKNYKSPGAKRIAEQRKKSNPNPRRPAKRVNVHGDGKPNHNRNR